MNGGTMPRPIWTFDELPDAVRVEFPKGEDLLFVEVDAGVGAEPSRAFVPYQEPAYYEDQGAP